MPDLNPATKPMYGFARNQLAHALPNGGLGMINQDAPDGLPNAGADLPPVGLAARRTV
jgi:hypothetical protein